MLYTSRYSNPELRSGKYTVVGITRGKPKFPLGYELAGNIIEIAPPGYLFNEYDRARFTPQYFRHMDKTGIKRILDILASYQKRDPERDVVLCCYEDVRIPGEWCHRLVFAEWWNQRTGEIIEELPDPSTPKGGVGPHKFSFPKSTKQPEQKTVQEPPRQLQLSLW